MRKRAIGAGALWVMLAVSIVFLTVPTVAIFISASPRQLISAMGDPVAIDALKLSFECSLASLAFVLAVGTPAAWVLARHNFRGKGVVTTLIELPLVLPPAVAGLGLLAALGPLGLFGGWLDAVGANLVLETAGVVVALVFVSAPFHMRQAQAAFESINPQLIDAARTLGAGEWRILARIAMPTSAPQLIAGAALAWGRALGEFGATLMFAGSLRGVTQTAPLEIYEQFSTDLVGAQAVAAVLVAASAAVLLTSKFFAPRRPAADG